MRKYLSLIQRPSNYLGSEWGALRKGASGVEVRLALAFPDLYEVGMSYLGMKILSHAVNRDPRFAAERVFAPAEDAAKVLRAKSARLASLESDTPLCDFDAVAFSLTHELCYANVLYMLELGGIPLRTAERGEADPFVLAGGGCAFNAEPAAPFIDAMAIGDGERLLPAMLEVLADSRAKALSRRQTLVELARLPGVYVPSFYREETPGGRLIPDCPELPELAERGGMVEKALVPDLSEAPFPTMQAVPFGQTAHDRFIIEIARGCTRGCRFCQAGMIYRPVRERSLEAIDSILRQGLAETGFEDLSFLSLSTGDFSALQGLFDKTWAHCKAEQASISMPSLRVGSLSPSIIKSLGELRRTGATIAPEAGSQRLRDVINKGVTEEGLLSHTLTLFENGWNSVKLYFMIGLPTETDDDLRAILDLCQKVARNAQGGGRRLQVSASISPFVPKPHTPFQWEPMIGLDEIRHRVEFLRDLFKPHRRLTLRWHDPEMSYLEGVFSRGDRRLAAVVESAYRRGALFASWSDRFRLAPWLEALAENGLSPDAFLAGRDPESGLPWEHLGCGVSKKFLLRERRRALEGKVTPDCRYAVCQSCGVCVVDGRTSTLTEQAKAMDIRPRLIRATRDQEETREEPREKTEEAARDGLESASSSEQATALAAASANAGNDPAAGANAVVADAPASAPIAFAADEAATTAAAMDAKPTPPEAVAQPTGSVEAAPPVSAGSSDLAPLDAPSPALATPAAPAKPKRPAKVIPAGPGEEMTVKAAMFRVRFRKLGQAAFLSQLELQRALERTLRRARLPLSFSAGFHPTPHLSFGRALPVGVRSLDEWFLVTLRRDVADAELLAGLRRCLPVGLLAASVERLPLKKVQSVPLREEYLLLWRDAAQAAPGLERWREFMAAESFPWTKQAKKGPKVVDLRPLVLAADPAGRRGLRLRLDVAGEYVNPLKLVQAVLPGVELDAFILVKLRQELA